MSCELKDLFLCTTVDKSEYMRIPYNYFPEDIIIRYNIEEKVLGGYIYARIKQGMYVIKQASILDYEQLMKHFNIHEYYLVIGTNAIFSQKN